MVERQMVSVFGLGSMGLGIACSALAGGHNVLGFDIDAQLQSNFVARGGQTGVMEDAVSNSHVVVSVVLNGSQTEDLLFGVKGVVPQMQAGSVVVSCATLAPETAQSLANKCKDYQVLYLDAPISGGPVKALKGALTIMASGPKAAFDAAMPVLLSISENVSICSIS